MPELTTWSLTSNHHTNTRTQLTIGVCARRINFEMGSNAVWLALVARMASLSRFTGAGLLLMFATLIVHPGNALADGEPDCSVPTPTGRADSSTLYVYQFDSGARWSLCWHMEQTSGLTLTQVHYAAPNEPMRQVLEQASLGQILFKYDEATSYRHLLSDTGLGGTNTLDPSSNYCNDGELVNGSVAQDETICVKQRDLNLMIQLRQETPIRRHQVSLHSWSSIDNFIYQTIWQLSEDGEIQPVVEVSGQLARFTDDQRFGSPVGNDRFASNATFLFNWRLHFNIDGSESRDVVEEIQFPFNVTNVVRRPFTSRAIETETYRNVDREQFRGWLVSDSVTSSAVDNTLDTRIGYYLDPQPSGFSYISRQHNWALFDLALTRSRPCEQLASINVQNPDNEPACAGNLDFYTDGESLNGAQIVAWYSLARHLTPDREDFPAIGSLRAAFKLIPFDWSAQTPFSSTEVTPAGTTR